MGPKMIAYSKKLATDFFEGKMIFSKFKDYEFKGQNPLASIKLHSEKYGVEDGMLVFYLDLTKPKNANIAKL